MSTVARRARVVPVLVALLGLLATVAGPVGAQTTYIDPGGRFAIDLPEDWELQENDPEVLFRFGAADLSSTVIVVVYPGSPDRVGHFEEQMETMAEVGTLDAIEEGVVDTKLNGLAARRGTFTLELHDGGRGVLHMGALELGPETGLTYQASIAGSERESEGTAIREMLDTVREPGTPVTGVSDARPVEVEVPGPETEMAPDEAGHGEEAETEGVPGVEEWETFRHDLVSLRYPPDWELEEGDGAIVANLSHEEYGSIHVAATEGDGFGDSAEKILGTWRDATQGQLPALEPTGDPWEEETRSGELLLLQELRGALVIEGEEVPQVFVLAAARYGDRGLGISTAYRASEGPEAREAILEILRTIR